MDSSARKALLAKEKESVAARQGHAERLALPWVKVEKDYVFDAADGEEDAGRLFEGRGELVVYHFMFGPGWAAGCAGCSFVADHVDGAPQYFKHHDVSYVAVARAPLANRCLQDAHGLAFQLGVVGLQRLQL